MGNLFENIPYYVWSCSIVSKYSSRFLKIFNSYEDTQHSQLLPEYIYSGFLGIFIRVLSFALGYSWKSFMNTWNCQWAFTTRFEGFSICIRTSLTSPERFFNMAVELFLGRLKISSISMRILNVPHLRLNMFWFSRETFTSVSFYSYSDINKNPSMNILNWQGTFNPRPEVPHFLH